MRTAISFPPVNGATNRTATTSPSSIGNIRSSPPSPQQRSVVAAPAGRSPLPTAPRVGSALSTASLTSSSTHRRHYAGPRSVRQQRQCRLNLWSAVALQQHVTMGAAAARAAPRSHYRGGAASTPNGNGGVSISMSHQLAQPQLRQTLAQKMRLVPAPPPPPTEEDWRAVETRAVLRMQHAEKDARAAAQRSGAEPEVRAAALASVQVCAICRDTLRETHSTGTGAGDTQVILSCSHVFHETCFRQFERIIRQQQRAEGAGPFPLMTRMACPECRATDYSKRTFIAGRAAAQRAAIVRVQAVLRGFLARRRYRHILHNAHPEQRAAFVTSRLSRLAVAWEECLQREEVNREAVLAALEAQRQEAAAAFLSEVDWQDIIEKRIAAGGTCAICLEVVQPALRPSQWITRSGDRGRVRGKAAHDSGIRCDQLRKLDSTEIQLTDPGATTAGPSTNGRDGSDQCSQLCEPAPRYGVIVSCCGHAFHETCLGVLERYAERLAAAAVLDSECRNNGGVATVQRRCPMCRSGYGKHAY